MVVLLLFALALTGVLAYEAQAAAKSHRVAAEAALRDYASFAMWELTQHAEQDMLGALISTLIGPLTLVDPENSRYWPTAADFRVAVGDQPVNAKYLRGSRFFFRFIWKDSSVLTSGRKPSREVLRWLKDTVASYPTRFPFDPEMIARSRTTLSADTTEKTSTRPLGVVVTPQSYVTTIDSVDGQWRMLAFVVARSRNGDPLVTYGYETNPQSFVTPFFYRAFQRNPLLPPSLVENAGDSLLAISVQTLQGRQIFHSPVDFKSRFIARDTLDERFAHLEVSVALHPQMASSLVVGGIPPSRLPLLALLLALTSGLVAMAILQLRRQQELAQTRQEFVSGVSHELRTPLAQIRLFAELLRKGHLQSDEERNRSLEIIDEESQRLTYLVENVLSFSRSEHASASVSMEPLPVREELVRVTDAFTPLARARQNIIQVDAPDDLVAFADPRAVRQILLNLLDNAVKYGPVGQTVTIGGKIDNGRVRLWVADSGPGVPAAERERIWDPYFRLARDADTAGGSGIGLSIVKELVRLQGGRIWVEDRASRKSGKSGARFVIELQLAAPDAVRAGSLPSIPEPAGVIA
ncbi:MAG: HAMP domain-containing histidine kinase [Gemmatimonadaceae bacterium]|nr:HAMP domain-containing histidine kinase [Gemmatimonadaceae bacterium]